MMVTSGTHQPVLLSEVVAVLAVVPDGVYVDGTFGRGGHSRAIVERLGQRGKLVAIDRDPEAVAAAGRCFGGDARVVIKHGSFADIGAIVRELGLQGQVNGVVLDLGVSSPQLDDPARGFSFQHDGPLDMRMDPGAGPSAAKWLATAGEKEIAAVMFEFGEERYGRRIARAIVRARDETPIETTGRLASVIAKAVPTRERSKDPATRSFQAIRIFINHELDDLRACLSQVPDLLAPGGRLAVISFHSLEDRIVKRFIRGQARGDDLPPGLPVPDVARHPRMRPVGKPTYPGDAEVRNNPRARSAVLRVAEKVS
jgi:16S rRNA (cytosine1402-N4)-methyltransferase